jgi:hypothetical protein
VPPAWARAHLGVRATYIQGPELQALPAIREPAAGNLTRLHLLTNVSSLQLCTVLRELLLCNCPLLADLAPLRSCSQLEFLNLQYCANVKSLDPLEHPAIRSIRVLNLTDTGVHDLRPLQPLSNRSLNLEHCLGLTSLEPLFSLSALTSLDAPPRTTLECLNI